MTALAAAWHKEDMRTLRLLRAFLGLSRGEVCAAARLSIRELSRIEAGEAFPTAQTMQRLDAAFHKLLMARLQANLGEPDGKE